MHTRALSHTHAHPHTHTHTCTHTHPLTQPAPATHTRDAQPPLQVRSRMEKDEQLGALMAGFRGSNLSDADFARSDTRWGDLRTPWSGHS